MKHRLDDILNATNGDDAIEKYLNREKKEDSSQQDVPKVLKSEDTGDDAIQKYLDSRKPNREAEIVKSADLDIHRSDQVAPSTPLKQEQKISPEKEETVVKDKASEPTFSIELPLEEEVAPVETVETKPKASSPKVKPKPKPKEAKVEKPPTVLRKPKEQPVVVSDGGSKINPNEIPKVQVDILGEASERKGDSFVDVESSSKEEPPKPEENLQKETPVSQKVEPVTVKDSNQKANEHSPSANSLMKVILNVVTFGGDLKKVLTFGIIAFVVTFSFALYKSVTSDAPLSKEYAMDGTMDALVDFTRSPQFESNDIGKEEMELKMERAVNERKPANYYVLLDQYPSLLKKTKHSEFQGKKGVVIADSVMLELDPTMSKLVEVNEQDAPLNGAITAWAIQTDSAELESKLKEEMDTVKVAIESVFYNKELDIFKDKKANEALVAFTVERVIGEPVNVERILVKSGL